MLPSTSRLGEYEFAMISQLRAQLIMHHPYRTLVQLKDEFDLTQDELTVAWCIINDHYVTDLPFLFPPYIIAFMAIVLALVITLSGKVSIPSPHSATSTAGTPVQWPPSATPGPGSTNAEKMDRSQFTAVLVPLENGLVSIDLPDRVEEILDSIGTSEICLQDVMECAQDMVALYQVWDLYRESECREMLVRLVRGRGMDK